MPAPVRLQLSTLSGFDLQAVSLATNGLPGKKVARPSPWGNPFVIGFAGVHDATTSVEHFRVYAEKQLKLKPNWLFVLRSHNLGCWCEPGEPCHADVLLELANR